MTISKAKQKAIKLLLVKVFPKVSRSFLKALFEKIILILENKKVRSLPEHRFYWAFVTWLSANLPDDIQFALGIDKATPDLIHELLKAKFDISSTAFDNMDQDSFHDYFSNCKVWIATFFFKSTTYDLEQMINETVDDTKD